VARRPESRDNPGVDREGPIRVKIVAMAALLAAFQCLPLHHAVAGPGDEKPDTLKR